MANYVLNKLTFLNLTAEDKDFILSHFVTDGAFDFNKIIPEPTTEANCPEDYKLNRNNHHLQIDSDKPWFNWYKWRLEHWDNKWNAANGYITEVHTDSVTFVFETAWSAPFNIYKTLSNKYKFDFDVCFADEDIYGTNCGYISSYNSHYTEQIGTDLFNSSVNDLTTYMDDLWFNYGRP